MKCPLRKSIDYSERSYKEHNPYQDRRTVENFMNCIEAECAAWNKDDKICNYFSGKRKVDNIDYLFIDYLF